MSPLILISLEKYGLNNSHHSLLISSAIFVNYQAPKLLIEQIEW
jgi:hypothetical protein